MAAPRRTPWPAWLLLTLLAGPVAAQTPAGRQLPPDALACPRDQLTSYDGLVQHYQRGPGRTEVRIRTDWATTETVRILHPGSDDPSRWFLIERRPFSAADWLRIEAAPGQLRAGLRVAAWVCDDGRNPVLDWAPPAAR